MDWFGWQLPKDRAHKAPPFGPQALLQDLDTRVPRYLDDVDQGKLIYPACKRARSDAGGDVSAIGTTPGGSSNCWANPPVSRKCSTPISGNGPTTIP